MRCDDARSAWTERRYNPSTEAHAHIATCAECTAFVQQQTALDTLLAAEVNDPPGPGFDSRFFARLEELKAQPQRNIWSWLRWLTVGGALATAAALAVFIVPGHDSATPEDMAIAMNLDLLQEDVGMLKQLDDVEAYEVITRLPADDPALKVPR